MKYCILIIVILIAGCQKRGSEMIVLGGKEVKVAEFIKVHNFNNAPFTILSVNGKDYRFLIDTGATGFLLTESMIQESGLEYSNTKSMTAHGITETVTLKMVDSVEMKMENGITITVRNVAVVPDKDYGLLPYAFLQKMDAIWDTGNNTIFIRAASNKAVQTEHVTGSFQPRSGQEFAAE